METNVYKREVPVNYSERLAEIKSMIPDTSLPYVDPVVLNPEELATFPKAAPKAKAGTIEAENQAHPISVQHSAVRDGRNIVRTDTAQDTDGYM